MGAQVPGAPPPPAQPPQPPVQPPYPPAQPPAQPPPAQPPPAQPPQPAAPGDPHRGTLVLVLGILGLIVCPPVAIAAWIMGNRDLAAMDQGRMDASGRGTTNAGRIIGMVAVCLWVLGVIVAIVLTLTGVAIIGRAAQQPMEEIQGDVRVMEEGPPAGAPSEKSMPGPGPGPAPTGARPDPAALMAAGMAAKKAGNLEEAAAKFMEAVKAAPDNAEAHWGLAWVLSAQDKKTAAIQEFQAVTRLTTNAEMRKGAEEAIARLSK